MNQVLPRARRPNSLGSSIVELLGEYGLPMPTHAVRVILTDRGRPATAEHLASIAASERTRFLRTGVPPRLCSAIDTSAHAVTPRWWAHGDWRLQRRIQTDETKTRWEARLADQLCLDLADRQRPPEAEITTLARATIARLGIARYFDGPGSPEEWISLRSLVVGAHPVHSVDGLTDAYPVEQRLLAEDTPAVELYFGRRE